MGVFGPVFLRRYLNLMDELVQLLKCMWVWLKRS